MKAIIVDDEERNRITLRKMLEEFCPIITVTGEAHSVDQAIHEINSNYPDIVFLDVQLGDETGFDMLKRLEQINFKIVFVTAYDKYAVDAIKFNAIDYLLKPVNINELISAVEKVKIESIQDRSKSVNALIHNISNPDKQSKKISIPVSNGYHVFQVGRIISCKADDYYTYFNLTEKEQIMATKTLGYYEEMLNEYGIIRVHKSHLANLARIRKYITSEPAHLVMDDNSEIPVAKTRRMEIQEILSRL